MKFTKLLKNGIVDENPVLVQVIGMCPTLGVTTSAINGLGMGLSTTAVLICSNIVHHVVWQSTGRGNRHFSMTGEWARNRPWPHQPQKYP